MKLRTNKTIITLAATFFAVALLSACGDEITEITNSGLQSVASVKDLGKCTNKNEGDVAYVKGTVYLCADSTWKEMEFSGNEVKGKNGSNGENGTYCIVSALKDNSGYDIICDGEKIGTLLNGDDGEKGDKGAKGDNGDKGAKGDAGTDCSAKALKDGSGFELYCAGKSVGIIQNGENGIKGEKGEDCSGKVLEDGSGIELSCGDKVVGTLSNGESTTGSDCTINDDGKGTVTINCGDDYTLTRYKALCGAQPYDPEKKMCLGSEYEGDGELIHILMHLCGGKPYIPEKIDPEDGAINEMLSSDSKQFCKEGVIYEKCGDKEINTETHFCFDDIVYEKCEKNTSYNPDYFACVDGKLRPACNGIALEDNQICEYGIILTSCGKNYFDATKQFCLDEKKSAIKDLCGGKPYKETEFCGNDNKAHALCSGQTYDTDNERCDENGKLLKKCVDNGEEYDPKTQVCKDGKVLTKCGNEGEGYDPEREYCDNEQIKMLLQCGNEWYNPNTQMCDNRDGGRVYKITTITIPEKNYSETWMAENLNYATENSYCAGEKETDQAAFCAKYGRFYTWATAVGKSEEECGNDKSCTLGNGDVQGVCPDGWHLPSHDEFLELILALGGIDVAGKALKSVDGWANEAFTVPNDDTYSFAALPTGFYSNGGFYGGDAHMVGFWSSTRDDVEGADLMCLFFSIDGAYLMSLYDFIADSDLLDYSKVFAFSVRCIRNK